MGVTRKNYCPECQQLSKYDVSEVGTVYTANWKKGPRDCWDENEKIYVEKKELIKVALHSLGNTPSLFLKELKRHYYSRVKSGLMIRLFGVTRETVTGHLMMVAETVEWDLRHYVSHHFARLTWERKLSILHSIACALEQLHNGEQVHRDKTTHGKFFKNHLEIPVNELGLGDKPSLRPSIRDLVNQLGEWHLYKKQSDQFDRAERKRLSYMKSKGLDTSPNRLITPPKIHPQAIYTSRKLKFPIIPLNTQKMLRNTTTYEDQSSTIDMASLMRMI
ncbi:1318_t:CDS:2 [Rhizophagus irregularis]|nr:1318_t:CDS:2 [Rhizophagus irregularis]